MSNSFINIRFLFWHFQATREWDYVRRRYRNAYRFSYNRCHWDRRLPDGIFSIYEFDLRNCDGESMDIVDEPSANPKDKE